MREVIANLTKDFRNSTSPFFGEFMLRGKMVQNIPLVINEYYNLLVEHHVEPESDFNIEGELLSTPRSSSWW